MCFIRRGLDFIFTQEELHWLDDILPMSSCCRKRKSSSSVAARTYPSAADFSSKVVNPSPLYFLLSSEIKGH